MRGVRFEWRLDNPAGLSGPDMGVIAQEVEAVFPELVSVGADGFKRVNYNGLLAPLIEAIKELDDRLAAVEARLADKSWTGTQPPPAS